MKLQAAQNTEDMLRKQLTLADEQAEKAKQAVRANAASVQELAAKRMELLGQLQAAKMQEKVNDAMASMTATVGQGSPSLEEVENKIQARMAKASATAELDAATGDGAIAELKRSTMELQAASTLDSLRAELGLGAAPELPAATPAPDPGPPPA